MQSFENILVGVELNAEGTDATTGSRKALAQGIWAAKATGAKLVVLHSSYYDEREERLGGGGEVVHEGTPNSGRDALNRLVDEARTAGVDAHLEVSEERPWIEISRRALRGEVDLVVVGKRNEAEEDGRRLGSVSIKLLRKCPCAVWTVKPGHDLVQKLVLGAADLSDVGLRVARNAAWIAKQHGCEVHLVHALTIPMSLQLESGRISDEEFAARVEELRSDAVNKLREAARPVWPEDEGLTIHVGKGAPFGTIQEAVAHLDPDLLVMGTATQGIAGVLLGTTAERLLPRVECSILALKPEGFVSPVKAD